MYRPFTDPPLNLGQDELRFGRETGTGGTRGNGRDPGDRGPVVEHLLGREDLIHLGESVTTHLDRRDQDVPQVVVSRDPRGPVVIYPTDVR